MFKFSRTIKLGFILTNLSVRYLYLFLIIVGLFSCSQKRNTPSDVIPEEKMVQFLMDVHIEEARLLALNLPRDSARTLFDEIEKKLFKKHGLDDSVYKKSYEYYLNDVKGLDEIYGAIVDSLSLRERLSKTLAGDTLKNEETPADSLQVDSVEAQTETVVD